MKLTGRRRRGFSLIEAAVSTLVVGLLLVAAMGTLHAAKATQVSIALRSRASAMAQSMMSEALALSYADPNQSAVFGLETGEVGTTRALYDDVDDLHALDETPPRDRDGTALDGAATSKWRRRVTVAWVDATNFATERNVETGVKRIKVEVLYAGKPMATLVSVRGQYP
jgi:type II secretory pathway pseudopilin PulG